MQDSDKRAKNYSDIKYGLSLLEEVYIVFLLVVFLSSGFSSLLSGYLWKISGNRFFVSFLYLLIVSLAYYLLNFPVNFYRSFLLEHQFSLSNEKLKDWFFDQLKGGVISYLVGLFFINVIYFFLLRNYSFWWFEVSLCWIIFSVFFAKVMPIVVIPLFFKYKELTDQALKQRIIKLADKMKVKIMDCFEINLSKKSLKANAAFVGIGNTRRVLLADTLKDKYSHDEVEVILAHEFAHYRLKHLLKLILMNSAAITLIFYLLFKSRNFILGFFGLHSLSDIAALPVIMLYFVAGGFILQPVQAYLSRRFEKNADRMALKVTGAKEAFISMMEKLSQQNLADRNPHPLIKFFFFDHPPVDERIKMAKEEK